MMAELSGFIAWCESHPYTYFALALLWCAVVIKLDAIRTPAPR